MFLKNSALINNANLLLVGMANCVVCHNNRRSFTQPNVVDELWLEGCFAASQSQQPFKFVRSLSGSANKCLTCDLSFLWLRKTSFSGSMNEVVMAQGVKSWGNQNPSLRLPPWQSY